MRPARIPLKKRAHSSARGYNRKWQRLRLRFLQQHPLCIRCLAEGKVREAEEVHHAREHKGPSDPRFWDEGGWEPICKPHHSAETLRQAREE